VDVTIRRAGPTDLEALKPLRSDLWPKMTEPENDAEVRSILAGESLGTLPMISLVAETVDGTIVGFAEVGLRSHANGCDPARPVGFLEGWYVSTEHRGQGVGRALVEAAVDWARAQGCREFASDTWLDHEGSQRAHRAVGFEEVERCVNYRMRIG
jgi:aminoglycoside 6'-N-acetyltransferase I